MTKSYKLDGLDCASCASKIERAVKSINGVKSAAVNFFTTKLTVEIAGGAADDINDRVVKALKKAAPDVTVKSI